MTTVRADPLAALLASLHASECESSSPAERMMDWLAIIVPPAPHRIRAAAPLQVLQSSRRSIHHEGTFLGSAACRCTSNGKYPGGKKKFLPHRQTQTSLNKKILARFFGKANEIVAVSKKDDPSFARPSIGQSALSLKAAGHYTPQPLPDPLQATSSQKLDYGRKPKLTVGVGALYGIEAMATIGGTLMSIGIFFYMNYRFAWTMSQNFLLAAAQGVVYVPGALLAGPVAARFGKDRTLGAVYVLLTLLTGISCLLAWLDGPWAAAGVVAALLVYTFSIGISWPILEGLVASGGPPLGMSRRLGIYNIIWPAGGALAIAVEGTILKYWIAGLFLIPCLLHLLSAGLVGLKALRHEPAPDTETEPPLAHVQPEPELIHKRKLALWLSRSALPATYTVIYGLMPMMPSLPSVRPLPTTLQTLVASVWLITRWVAFLALALTSWWHTRPRALIWAAVVMLISFFGMTLRPTQGASPATDLIAMILWQAVLGLAIGMIYSASLYFGMVLSEGSTEHGGYHEALIGLGWFIGPAAGAAAQEFHSDDPRYGIAAVGTVIAISVAVVLVAAVRGARREGFPIDKPNDA